MRIWKRNFLLLSVLASICVIVVSAWKLYDYYAAADQCQAVVSELMNDAVVFADDDARTGNGEELDENSNENTGENSGMTDLETETEAGYDFPFTVNFDELRKTNPDTAAWIYSEGTAINYPVMKSSDNHDYLRTLPDGSYNYSGSLFIDCRNQPDFTDLVTIIYGHNMMNNSMFGSLPDYRNQTYYEEHPVMWLSAPKEDYRIDLIAGCQTRADSGFYRLPNTEEKLREYIEDLLGCSSFRSTISISENDRYVLLSTCSYEFSGARYVLLGKLTELKNQKS